MGISLACNQIVHVTFRVNLFLLLNLPFFSTAEITIHDPSMVSVIDHFWFHATDDSLTR